jgi:hypothetical protein
VLPLLVDNIEVSTAGSKSRRSSKVVRYQRPLATLIPGLLLALSSTPALAGGNSVDARRVYGALTNPSNNLAAPNKPVDNRAKNPHDGIFTHLKTAPQELPGMSLPSDKDSFSYGMTRPQPKGGTLILLTYKQKASKDAILQGYVDSLKGAGWAATRRGDQVSGFYHGNSVTIEGIPYRSKDGWNSQISFFYSLKDR